MIIDFNWFNSQNVKNVLSVIIQVINIVRIIVPIGLVVMTTFDIAKKVINPDEKEGQQKIMIRLVASVLVFLSPIIINFVLHFMNIDTKELTGITSKDITPTYDTPQTPVEVSSISLFGCPTSLKVGETAVLKTNISNKYNGGIRWEQNTNAINVMPSADKRSATIELVDDTQDTVVKVTVSAGDVQKTCYVVPNSTFSIKNCPSFEKVYKPGEKIKLVTDVSSKYNGKILWDQSYNVFKMTPNDSDNSVTLEVVDNPESTVSTVTAYKNGKRSLCLIYVEKPKLDSVSITNCPSGSLKYAPGEEITLSTDIPMDFKGEIEWKPDSFTNNFIITPSEDKRSATLRVIDNPTSGWSTTSVIAGGKASACLINVVKTQNN